MVNGGCNAATDDGGCGIPLLFTVVGVSGRIDLVPINGDSRFVRESPVRGEADGDDTAGGKYGL